MNPNKRQKGRKRPNKRSQRAARSIVRDAQAADLICKSPEFESVERRAKLSVKRPVSPDNNPFFESVISSVIEHPDNMLNIHGAMLGVSLLSARDSSNMLRLSNRSPGQLCNEVKSITRSFPEELEGYLGSVIVVGVKKHQTGSRYVGVALSRKTSDGLRFKVSEERNRIVSPYVQSAPDLANGEPVHHISLFRTTDQHKAEEVSEIQHSSGIIGAPITLAEPEVNLKIQRYGAI